VRSICSAALILLLILLLVSCTAEETRDVKFKDDIYRLEKADGKVTVFSGPQDSPDIVLQPLSGGQWGYVLSVGEDEYYVAGDARNIRVQFPDGRILHRLHENGTSTGHAEPGTPHDFEDWDRVDQIGKIAYGTPVQPSAEPRTGSRPAGLPLLVAGLISVVRPQLAFCLDLGWRLRDAEPSEVYLVATRVIGAALLVAGLILIF